MDEELSPISCVKIVSVAVDKNIVEAGFSMLMRMPVVAAVFKKAMADKHVRVEDGDYEQPNCRPKQPRIECATTRSGGRTRQFDPLHRF